MKPAWDNCVCSTAAFYEVEPVQGTRFNKYVRYKEISLYHNIKSCFNKLDNVSLFDRDKSRSFEKWKSPVERYIVYENEAGYYF